MKLSRRWLWLLALVPIALGLARLHFDVEVLNLLPSEAAAVQGLKIYQQNFANARELILSVRAPDAETAEATAGAIAGRLRRETNLVSQVTWQPPWLEHPAQAAELIAYLWLNQPPAIFGQLTNRLAATNLDALLAATRNELATSMSPGDLARLSYDPFGLTRLPESVSGSAPRFGEGQEMFASADGTFRILFIKARADLATYRECAHWLEAAKRVVNEVVPLSKQSASAVSLGYTGRPAFVAEIAGGMERDVTLSVGGTSLIIAALFWFAHRRWKPMLWLLTLLALILTGTLALGGLLFGTINVVSMGFAAILLGLAVDYAVVHYQEALAHPDLSVPEVRRAIAPSIFWAAVTTITAFLVLNFGGLPGLAQLGSLVGIGVALSALVMIFAFLPPLFPDRKHPRTNVVSLARESPVSEPVKRTHMSAVFAGTAALLFSALIALSSGLPGMDATANALRPRNSPAYAALEGIKQHLNQKREPLWLIVQGQNEREVARRLDALTPVLDSAVSNRLLAGFTLPAALWPRSEFQAANRQSARRLAAERVELRAAAAASGFAENALVLTESVLDTWQRAQAVTGVFWPTNPMSEWIFEKFVARAPTNFYALGLLHPVADTTLLARFESQLPSDGVRLSGWELLGGAILASVKSNLWKLVLPMVGLVLLSLWLAFRRFHEVFLSLSVLLISGFCLLAVMRIAGWSWNLLNLMALPLILGTGVDYSIFMQLALRRHRGDLTMAYRSVGRALLLCGATAVAGFGSLAWSSNAGMSSLGQVCAVGIGGNMLVSVFLLPVWWRIFAGQRSPDENLATQSAARGSPPAKPSRFYRTELWQAGISVVRRLSPQTSVRTARVLAGAYWKFARARREVVIQNLLPVFDGNRKTAERSSRVLFHNFAIKLADLFRYESGQSIDELFGELTGWEHFVAAQSTKRGILLLTPHLGNWEFGAPLLARRGVNLLVITLAEPQGRMTAIRRAARARWGIETLVVGSDPFAFVEIIRRLEAGATVALLMDRPPEASAVSVELFGRTFAASVAAAELARASGCALLPVYLPRTEKGYAAHILAQIPYDRAALRSRELRHALTQEIMRAFAPAIRQYPDQWYHFVPVWPK
jgi:predicted exporter/lauroyl/myristoyl acyltransferase